MDRAAGIHLVVGTQRLGKRGAGDVAVTGNMPARLVFGTADAQDAAFFTGRPDSGAERLGRYPGDALLVSGGSLTRLAVAQVTGTDLGELAQGGREYRPWAASWATTGTTVVAERGQNGAATGNEAPLQPPVVGGCSGCEPVVGGCEVVVDGCGPVVLPMALGPATTEAERAAIRHVYARTGSKSETCRLVWGFKDGRTWKWLNEILYGAMPRQRLVGPTEDGQE